jgi:S1-C subfamily serine protease
MSNWWDEASAKAEAEAQAQANAEAAAQPAPQPQAEVPGEADVAWGVPYLIPARPEDTYQPIPAGVYTRPTQPHKNRSGLIVAASVGGVLVLGIGAIIGVHAYTDHASALESQSTTTPSNNFGNSNGIGNGGTGNGSNGNGNGLTDPNAGNGFGLVDPNPGNGIDGQNGSGTSDNTTSATSAQQVGVVDINTNLGLEGGQAAGTGMVITPDGEVLTNNHVIKGATSISVTIVSSGKTYTAKVLGYSKTDDVALIKLQGASGLQTVTTNTTVPGVGTQVVGVGNAGGVGGTPSAAAGTVTALDQDITATDAGGGDAERVTGLIATNAAIRAGDSGGPLMTTDNEVVGMDTAAGSNGGSQGFAIPIAHALDIAHQIENGQGSSTVHIGTTAFLGVQLQDNGGAQVVAAVPGQPAGAAGITAGSIITEFNGKTISSSADLIAAVSATAAGSSVSVHWTDANGTAHSAHITLAEGPAL